MTGSDGSILDLLQAYRREVLRWNTQINLVSRQDTAARLQALINQCDAALEALIRRDAGALAGPLLYCDVGSGGGLPGVVWHARLAAMGLGSATWLVEPRDKRAWFLERVARALPGGTACSVACARWGEFEPPARTAARSVLVSLKALRLPDPVVLAGLDDLVDASSPPSRVLVARFYPGGTGLTDHVAGELAIGAPGREVGPWCARGGEAFAVPAGPYPDAALILSRYERS